MLSKSFWKRDSKGLALRFVCQLTFWRCPILGSSELPNRYLPLSARWSEDGAGSLFSLSSFSSCWRRQSAKVFHCNKYFNFELEQLTRERMWKLCAVWGEGRLDTVVPESGEWLRLLSWQLYAAKGRREAGGQPQLCATAHSAHSKTEREHYELKLFSLQQQQQEQ